MFVRETPHCLGGYSVIVTNVYIAGNALCHGGDILTMRGTERRPHHGSKAVSQGICTAFSPFPHHTFHSWLPLHQRRVHRAQMDEIVVPVAQRKCSGSVGILGVAEKQVNSFIVPCVAGYILCERGENREWTSVVEVPRDDEGLLVLCLQSAGT